MNSRAFSDRDGNVSEIQRFDFEGGVEEEEWACSQEAASRRSSPEVSEDGASEQVGLEEFWEEVVSGRLGLPPLPVKTSDLVSEDRCNAALLEGQLVTLSPSDLVG